VLLLLLLLLHVKLLLLVLVLVLVVVVGCGHHLSVTLAVMPAIQLHSQVGIFPPQGVEFVREFLHGRFRPAGPVLFLLKLSVHAAHLLRLRLQVDNALVDTGQLDQIVAVRARGRAGDQRAQRRRVHHARAPILRRGGRG
jgi:hypothetical protein